MLRRPALLVALLAAACEGEVHDNVATCEAFVASLSCGDADPSALISCEPYEREVVATCDAAPYFACLEARTTCDGEGEDAAFDVDDWPECAPLAICEGSLEDEDEGA